MSADEISTPEYLYHYTSIETLALVLKAKKIKLTRLDKVNDPTEELSRDGKLGKYIFVTCWTSQEQEGVPFWYMYGHNKRGVRIRLPTNFIKTYEVREQFHRDDGTVTTNGHIFDSIVPESVLLESSYLIANYVAAHNKFFPVEYTDDPEQLKPPIFSEDDDGVLNVALGELGKHKPRIWSFEQEWRLKLIFLPYGVRDINPADTSNLRHAMKTGKELDFDAYFLEISDEAFSQMEVTLGPSCTPGDKVIAEALIHKYTPGVLLRSSDLLIR